MTSETLYIKPQAASIAPEVQIIPYGSHTTEKGVFVLDEEAAGLLMADFASRTSDMVIDYEHQTLGGQEAPAAGWIKKLFVIPASKARRESPLKKDSGQAGMTNEEKSPGIWAVVEWTERAREYLKNREYRYLSPVFLKRVSDGRVVRLINAALTNQPAIDGMVPVVNKGAVPPAKSDVGARLVCESQRLGAPANQRKEVPMEKIFTLLGLQSDATEEQAAEAVCAMKGAVPPGINEALGLNTDASLSEVTGTIMAMKQAHGQLSELADLKSQISNLKSALARRDAEDLVAVAMKEGKVTPAQKDWAMGYAGQDPEGFRVYIAKAPVVVHMEEVGTAHCETGFAPDGVQIQVNKALGLSEETFKKHNKN